MDGFQQRLGVKEKDPDYEYRWLNDDKTRIATKTQDDDWDLVKSDKEDSHGDSDTVRRQVGVKPNGDPLFAYLARKPKRFCDEDRAKKQEALDEQWSELARGKRGDPTNIGGSEGYVATSTTIRDGRRS